MENEVDDIRVPEHGNGYLKVVGLSEESLEKLKAALKHGAYFVKVEDGKLIAISTFEELPSPIKDESMLPFWREAMKEERSQLSLLNNISFFNISEHSDPSIIIKNLCAFEYTKEKYEYYGELLESYGFECLRSRRDADFQYWEHWYLPGLWSAKGELKDRTMLIENKKEKLEIALAFLSQKISFGALDITSQRLCTPNPD